MHYTGGGGGSWLGEVTWAVFMLYTAQGGEGGLLNAFVSRPSLFWVGVCYPSF